MCAVRIETLKALEPIASLPEARLNELVGLCRTETASKDSDPFLTRGVEGQVVYLVRGELMLTHPDGSSKVLVGGSERSRYPLGRRGEGFTSAKAITQAELMRSDDYLLDAMALSEEAGSADPSRTRGRAGDERRS